MKWPRGESNSVDTSFSRGHSHYATRPYDLVLLTYFKGCYIVVNDGEQDRVDNLLLFFCLSL